MISRIFTVAATAVTALVLAAAVAPVRTAEASWAESRGGLRQEGAGALPIVPAYFDPWTSPQEWDRLIRTTPAGGMFVFSVGNLGPGPEVDPAYLDVVRRAQAEGIRAICYVETKKANGVDIRGLTAVKRDIDRCFDQYSPDGIFLDEVDGTRARYDGVAELSSYIRDRDPAALRILNAGQNSRQSFLGISDVLAIFEGPWDNSPLGFNFKEWEPSPWVTSWIAANPGGESRFWYMTYATAASDMTAAVQRAAALGGGNVYVTDGSGDARWDHLPAYWEAELDELAGACGPAVR